MSSIITFSQWYQDELSGLLRERLQQFLAPGAAAGGDEARRIIEAVLQVCVCGGGGAGCMCVQGREECMQGREECLRLLGVQPKS